MRIALGLEYDGTDFIGWQAQAPTQAKFPHGVRGVQTVLEQALSQVADHPVQVMAAGRTDAGVHATIQVVHFDTSAQRTERGWVMGANTNLPDSVSVLWMRPVPDDFHARFSAVSRSYRYVILNRAARPSTLRHHVAWIRHPLEAAAMHRAAQALLGENDFSSYRAAECQSPTPMRRVDRIDVSRVHDCVVVEITANAFLHHMVRNIVGVLLKVGVGQAPESWPGEVLAARDRQQASITAAAAGLYLFGIQYPPQFALPCAPRATAWPPGRG